MSHIWIEKDVVLAVHDQQIAEHGGAVGIRDAGLVESALARAQHRADYAAPDIYDLAAAYGHGLARNRGFVDGNKRTAYVVTRLFLRMNGWDLSGPPTERVVVFERLGKGVLTQDDFASWLRKHGTRI
jgi:death on curing protein